MKNLIGAIGKRSCEISLQKIMQDLGDRKVVNRSMSIILGNCGMTKFVFDDGYFSSKVRVER